MIMWLDSEATPCIVSAVVLVVPALYRYEGLVEETTVDFIFIRVTKSRIVTLFQRSRNIGVIDFHVQVG